MQLPARRPILVSAALTPVVTTVALIFAAWAAGHVAYLRLALALTIAMLVVALVAGGVLLALVPPLWRSDRRSAAILIGIYLGGVLLLLWQLRT